ncbi:MAG: hypothetical protein GY767_07965 [Shimia sp.]|nr:hypothetical protein [Shimia sp.]
MASSTEIANRALSKLGERRILDITDDSKPARAMNSRYETMRDAVLYEHPWRFAVERATLAALTSAPDWGYSLEYQLPTDALRLLAVGEACIDYRAYGVMFRVSNAGGSSEPYKVIGGTIQTDLSAPLKIEYIKRVTDAGSFDTQFAEALACRIAFDAAEELTQSNSKKEAAWAEYKDAISTGKRLNSIMNPPRIRGSGGWTQARVW